MRGFVVGKVVETTVEQFAVGSYVMGIGSWSDYSCAPAAQFFPMFDVPGASPKDILGYYYHIAPTAYFGLLDIGQPKIGETLVVSTAAGAVGSIASQLGKIWGCRVIGIAGGKRKCDWLTGELGLDGAIDYKSENLEQRLRELCPNGVDIFFDNVGGSQLNTVLGQMNLHGRMVLCGGISAYNKDGRDETPGNYVRLIVQRIRAEGFVVLDYLARYPEALRAIAILHAAGRLKWRYHDVERLEDADVACMELYKGLNYGKVMVKVA
jgi:NADPH-dependent curcumin reductase CurA